MISGFLKRNKKWIWLILIIGMVQVFLNIGILVSENLAHGEAIHWAFYVINEFTGVYCGVVLIPLMIWFFRAYPLSKPNLLVKIGGYLFFSLGIGILWTSMMYALRYVSYPFADIHRTEEIFNDLPFRYLMEYFKQFIVFWLVYYIHWNVTRYQDHQQQKERESRLEGELLSARLQSLQMQLHPHFFFNTLNTISSLMYADPKKADRLIARMSDFLREVIHSKDKPLHPLESEIALLKKYTDIMQTRYADKLMVDYEIMSESLPYEVPSLILQPLVENSIKYSIDYRDSTLITIKSKLSETQLLLEISDNGPGLDDQEITYGTGLTSTLQRLRVIYEDQYDFSITSPSNCGTFVVIGVPKKVNP